MLTFTAFILCLGLKTAFAASGVDYTKQGEWTPSVCTTGKQQSPINIPEPEKLRQMQWPPLKMDTCTIGTATLARGSTVTSNEFSKCMLSGGALDDKYKLAQFHMHWKKDSYGKGTRTGSEHAFDGVSYPLEVHFVFYRSPYASLGEALNSTYDRRALAVVGIMVETSDDAQPMFTPLASGWQKLIDNTNLTETTVNDLQSKSIVEYLPSNKTQFYSYLGSLTTPTCNEQVVWTVMKSPVKIKKSDLQKLHAAGGITRNDRNLQTTNINLVYYNGAIGVAVNLSYLLLPIFLTFKTLI